MLNTLSGRFLILTTVFVMLAEVLIFVPSIARFRQEYLQDRLERAQMAAIVDIQIDRLRKLLSDRKITLSLNDEARNWLANAGYDPVYGARPLKRTIQKNVQDPLAELILKGEVTSGDNVGVGVAAGQISLAVGGAAEAVSAA